MGIINKEKSFVVYRIWKMLGRRVWKFFFYLFRICDVNERCDFLKKVEFFKFFFNGIMFFYRVFCWIID